MKTYGTVVLILWVAVILALGGCQAETTSPEAELQAFAATVDEIYTEYAASLKAGDSDRWIKLWTEDGVQLPPDFPAVVGRENIKAGLDSEIELVNFDMEIKTEQVRVDGDMGFAWGNYTASLTPKEGGEPIPVDGKYLTIFNKQPDGSWKIYRDIFNSNVPPPAPAEVASSEVDRDAVATEIDEIFTEYIARLNAGDSTNWAALWAEDGVQLPPDVSPNVGKDAIAAKNKSKLEQVSFTDMAINTEEVEVMGDLAYARGLYTATVAPKAGGEPIPVDGKYLTVFKKQPDGSWKIYRDIFNSNVPPPAPAEVASSEVNRDAVAAEIDEIYTEYIDCLKTGDSERYAALWAEDGVQLVPGLPPNVGRDVIEADTRGYLEQMRVVDMEINTEEVEVMGDLAYARGLYTATEELKTGGEPVFIDGKYLTVFKKQPDGSWKIYRDIFNSNVPPSG